MARIDLPPDQRDQKPLELNVFLDCPKCDTTFDHTFVCPDGIYDIEDIVAVPEDDVTCPACKHEWRAEWEGWHAHDDA